MGSISIILRKPPYGMVDAAEAVRHALGGVTEDMDVYLLLLDSGVNAARKGQDAGSTGYAGIEEGIRDCIDMGVTVLVDNDSMKAAGIGPADLPEGAKISDSHEIAGRIKDSDTTMIF